VAANLVDLKIDTNYHGCSPKALIQLHRQKLGQHQLLKAVIS
jgi:hypothetical protein